MRTPGNRGCAVLLSSGGAECAAGLCGIHPDQVSRKAARWYLPIGSGILQNLNLKNPQAYLLASELSRLTGESLTAAVIAAL
jgi:hypothetical protein